MKQKFSTKWKASRQPRKQRKYIYNAPLHLKQKEMASPLSKELRKKYGTRNIEIRKGDEVKIMRGKNKKKHGKVSMVDVQRKRISIDGVQTAKKDGAKVNIWFNPSKVQIISLNTDDKKRMKRLKQKPEEKLERKVGMKLKENKGEKNKNAP